MQVIQEIFTSELCTQFTQVQMYKPIYIGGMRQLTWRNDTNTLAHKFANI